MRCLRGVDTLTAVGLCAEIGDFERFARAEQLMSYVGLVPSRVTRPGSSAGSGRSPRPGPAHARRLLVEAAWHYRKAPTLGKTLDRAPGRTSPPKRSRSPGPRSAGCTAPGPASRPRNKRRTIIAVAAARELAGFCWAITQIE